MKAKIYIDMDGCVAKWANVSIEDTFQPGYFLSREPDQVLIDAVLELGKHFDVSLLTAAYTETNARQEKDQWRQLHGMGNIPIIFVPYGKNKADFIDGQDCISILIDDYTVNLRQWAAEPNHYSIKYLNGINSTKGTWDGYAVSHRMAPRIIESTVKGIISELAA